MRMFSTLRKTHPRLGLAAFQHWYEQDHTGEYPGQRFCEILRHDESTGRCRRCGAKEHRQAITSRLLVGCNAGRVDTSYYLDCARPGCASMMSNYRRPW